MHRECPREFQDRIDQEFGTNQYGEPLYKFAWGQTETMRGGGAWANGFVGYKDVLVGGNDPCWMIMQWDPPQVYGSPAMWYYTFRDQMTGLQDLGEYPYHGRYRLIHKLIHRERVNGKVVVTAMDLSSMLIEQILPMVRGWQALSKEAQVEALRYEQRLREEEIARAAIEAKQSYAPAFKGNAVSFTRQGCRTSLIAKKEEFLEKNWKRLMQAASLYQRGMNQV
jgi:hypothetical protein